MRTGSALALAASLLLLAGLVTWTEYRTALDHAQATGHHLATTLEQHASRTIESVDYALRLTIDRWNNRPAGPLDAETGSQLLRRSLLGSPQVRALAMFGPDGKRQFSSDSEHMLPLDISDRDHFIQLRERRLAGLSSGLAIGTPVQSRTSGKWLIPVGRALRDSDGRFDGIIVAALDPDYFVQVYSVQDIGMLGTIALLRRDGILLARAPGRDRGENRPLGRLPMANPTALALLAEDDHADWQAPPRNGRPARLLSFQASPTLPFVAVVSLARDEMLAGWRNEAWRTMCAAAALALLLVLYTLRLAHEVARREIAFAQLARAEARLRDAIDVMPEQLMIFDADDRLVLCNDAVRKLDHPPPNWSSIGLTFEEILFGRASILTPAGRRARRFLEKRLAYHRSPGPPEELTTPDGRTIRMTERRTAEGGSVLLRVDVTELHQLAEALREAKAEAERASHAKSDFLAAMSHELRTPLNGIIGFTDLVLGSSLTLEQRHRLNHVRSAGQGLLAIVSEVLDLAKIEAGRTEIETADFALPALVEDCAALVEPTAAAKQVAVRCFIDPTLPTLVRGDSGRLRQVLLNLLSNAVRFTDEGEISVTVSANTGPGGEAGPVRFSVQDSGIGIEAGKIPLLFERFSQVGDPARHAGGAGLGLAISRVLVRLMGGEIAVESHPGQGSMFSFAIPLAAAATRIPRPRRRDSSASAARPGRILLAEDMPLNQELTKAILAGAGHELDVVCDGGEAVAAARRQRYDLVLMDLQMPSMDGIAAAREIHRLEPKHDRTPIIALTAGAMEEDRQLSTAAGLDGHLDKPFDAATLLAAIAPYAGLRSQGATLSDIALGAA